MWELAFGSLSGVASVFSFFVEDILMEVAEKFKLFGVKKEKASIPARYRSSLIRFVAGAAFGLTSVVFRSCTIPFRSMEKMFF